MKETASKEIGSRIRELIFKLELNQSSFAKAVGVSQNAIFNTITGVTKTPRYTLLESILQVYPQVNRDWLLEGKGEMFSNTPVQSERGDGYLQKHLNELESEFRKELKEMRLVFQSELEFKNRQIEKLMDLLGKPSGVTGEAKVMALWVKKEEIGLIA
ncbi:helix-turn-helix domain-containing protein [Runella sp.]|uniref:helix-turn-helix domain-containing protein n=1 Tax=Runella sp. TaxID=1960881 RepID=UPI003D0FAF6B